MLKLTLFKRLILLFCLSWGCSDSDNGLELPRDCTSQIIIDKELYTASSSTNYTILAASIHDDCIEIVITASGCDGSSWKVDLYDSGKVAESFPVQRFIKFSLINQEVCDAVITQTYTFDLSPIELNNSNAILNLEGWSKSLLYEF